jgi:hypothetical protein
VNNIEEVINKMALEDTSNETIKYAVAILRRMETELISV